MYHDACKGRINNHIQNHEWEKVDNIVAKRGVGSGRLISFFVACEVAGEGPFTVGFRPIRKWNMNGKGKADRSEALSMRGKKKRNPPSPRVCFDRSACNLQLREWTNFDNTNCFLRVSWFLLFGIIGDSTGIRYLTARAVRSARLCEDRQHL